MKEGAKVNANAYIDDILTPALHEMKNFIYSGNILINYNDIVSRLQSILGY